MSEFVRSLCRIAIPVTLQSMLQASFSIIDQIMIGQLGETNIGCWIVWKLFSDFFCSNRCSKYGCGNINSTVHRSRRWQRGMVQLLGESYRRDMDRLCLFDCIRFPFFRDSWILY